MLCPRGLLSTNAYIGNHIRVHGLIRTSNPAQDQGRPMNFRSVLEPQCSPLTLTLSRACSWRSAEARILITYANYLHEQRGLCTLSRARGPIVVSLPHVLLLLGTMSCPWTGGHPPSQHCTPGWPSDKWPGPLQLYEQPSGLHIAAHHRNFQADAGILSKCTLSKQSTHPVLFFS